MNLQLVTGPAVDVVSLEDAKTHLRVDGTAEDTLITSQIKAATRFCEALCERAFIEQTWRLGLHGFPIARDDRGRIVLPISRLISVTSITYVDANGDVQTLDSDLYQVDNQAEPGCVAPAPGESWPSTEADRLNAVQIVFKAGYGTAASDVDPLAIQAVKIVLGHLYENRETEITGTISTELKIGVKQLLSPIWPGRLF